MDSFDSKTCDIIFLSFAYTIDEYTLHCWVKKSGGEVDSFVNNDIRLALFEVTLDDDYDIKETGNTAMSNLIARLKPNYVLPRPHSSCSTCPPPSRSNTNYKYNQDI